MSRVNLRFLILLLLTINLIRETEEKIREKRMIPRRNRNTIRSYGGAVGGIGTSEDGNRNSRIELDPNDRKSYLDVYGDNPYEANDTLTGGEYPGILIARNIRQVSFDPNAYSQDARQTGNGQRRYDEHYGERTDEPRF